MRKPRPNECICLAGILFTVTQTHSLTHKDKLQYKYNPSTILWRCKKLWYGQDIYSMFTKLCDLVSFYNILPARICNLNLKTFNGSVVTVISIRYPYFFLGPLQQNCLKKNHVSRSKPANVFEDLPLYASVLQIE